MRGVRLLVGALLVGGIIAGPGVGFAADCGAGGTTPNSSGSCKTATNQTVCGSGIDTGLIIVSAGPGGAEICNDGGTAFPVDGRAGAQLECVCVYIDGDDDNNHDLLLHGWLRIDQNGAWCRDGRDPNGNGYGAPGRPAHECFVGPI
ncbi:MAG TPA: hypothetical protein VM841_06885 [Actinomycetota bacterium]|nr:hypothetical protein [Actinomycetota bacterium]